ncbi:competence protein ComEC [Spirochaetia bacterium]|nr:competence protein ComEC [Spirochaetia bacterium]GHU30803.1 competence protein ComEC [Spirochaetia bacterium]
MELFKKSPVLWAAAGAALFYYVPLGTFFRINSLIFLVCVISLFRAVAVVAGTKTRIFRVFHIMTLSFSIGMMIGISANPQMAHLGVKPERVVGISGILDTDPRTFYDGRGMSDLNLIRVMSLGNIRTSARGTIVVFFPEESMLRLKEFGRGAEVYIEGSVLKTTGPKASFRARAVHINKPANELEQMRTGIRIRIIDHFSRFRWGGLALALLLGFRENLDSAIAGQFQAAGCSHILALSGMHLAIVAALLAFLLKKPLGLRASAIVSALCISVYVYVIGDQASLIRSAIMYLLGTAGILYALPKKPLLFLGFSFLIQIIGWPDSGHSVSFILSYLALAGILLLSGPVYNLIRGWIPDAVAQPLAASVGAFIATSTSVVLFFGILRPFGIITGLCIVPVTTLFMIGAFIFLASRGMIPFMDTMMDFLYRLLDWMTVESARVPGLHTRAVVLVFVASAVAAAGICIVSVRTEQLRNHCESFD